MKRLFLLLAIFGGLSLNGQANDNELQHRVQELELKLENLTRELQRRPQNCTLESRWAGLRHGRCPRGAYVREARVIGTNIIQVECERIELRCR